MAKKKKCTEKKGYAFHTKECFETGFKNCELNIKK